jgi:hypothetical protein
MGGRLVEGQPELGLRHGVHHRLVHVFRSFDEVRLADNDVGVFRELHPNRFKLDQWRPLREQVIYASHFSGRAEGNWCNRLPADCFESQRRHQLRNRGHQELGRAGKQSVSENPRRLSCPSWLTALSLPTSIRFYPKI